MQIGGRHQTELFTYIVWSEIKLALGKLGESPGSGEPLVYRYEERKGEGGWEVYAFLLNHSSLPELGR